MKNTCMIIVRGTRFTGIKINCMKRILCYGTTFFEYSIKSKNPKSIFEIFAFKTIVKKVYCGVISVKDNVNGICNIGT
jgi:hypothetical protein